MKVLLACANPLLRRSLVDALQTRSHEVELSTFPSEPAVAGVEPPIRVEHPAAELQRFGAAVVVDPSLGGFESEIAVRAMASLVDDVVAAGSIRLIEVRPLDADGQEAVARRSSQWLTIRASTVYGVGADVVTLLLVLMRSLPGVPLPAPTRRIQPLWHGDLSAAVAAGLELPTEAINRTAYVAGDAQLSLQDVYERIALAIGRRPVLLPVPQFIATHGAALAEALHLTTAPDATAWLGKSEAVLREGTPNDLRDLFDVTPVSLEAGLVRLIHQLDEVTPEAGTGVVEIKRFSAEIHGPRYDAAALMQEFRQRFDRLMPIAVGVEPAAPETVLREGTSITMHLPLRGHVQVRVEKVADHEVVLATVRGHALAGIVRFSAQPAHDALRFEVLTCDAAANPLDWVALTLGGARVQDSNWAQVVTNVVSMSGGTADGVESSTQKLSADDVARVETWLADIIERRRSRSEPMESITGGTAAERTERPVGR